MEFILKFSVVIINQGGGIAAPVAGQVLAEILPYLEIESQEPEIKESISMPNVTGLTLKEAKTKFKELNIEYEIQGELTEESVITKQVPSEGIQINTGTKVLLY